MNLNIENNSILFDVYNDEFEWNIQVILFGFLLEKDAKIDV